MNAYVLVPLYNRARDITGWAKVDALDAERVAAFRWRMTYFGYVIARPPGAKRDVLMHRLLLDLPHFDRRQGDHRNGDKLDNRRANLRVVTNAQNAQNQASKGGVSQYRGVSLRRDSGRWVGYVKVNYVRHCVGTYATEEEAATAVKELRAKLMPFDEPARHA